MLNHTSHSQVAMVKCSDYDYPTVRQAVRQRLDLLSFHTPFMGQLLRYPKVVN